MIVQVEDTNHKPVAGAYVTFTLPGDGPGGLFTNGSRIVMTTTDQSGRATAMGLRPNSMAGNFQVRVTANYQGQVGHAVVNQANAMGASSGAPGSVSTAKAGLLSTKAWVIIGAIAGGAAAGAAVAANHSGGRPASSISAGTGTVGPPQ